MASPSFPSTFSGSLHHSFFSPSPDFFLESSSDSSLLSLPLNKAHSFVYRIQERAQEDLKEEGLKSSFNISFKNEESTEKEATQLYKKAHDQAKAQKKAAKEQYSNTKKTILDTDSFSNQQKEVRALHYKWFHDLVEKVQIEHNKTEHNQSDQETMSVYNEVKKEPHSSFSSSSSPFFYIFISFSLPEESLREIAYQTKKMNETGRAKAVMVLRGLKNNSFKETAFQIQELSRGEQQQEQKDGLKNGLKDGERKRGEGKAIIHPKLFDRFGVTHVPTVVLLCGKKEKEKYDKLAGNVTSYFALERFEEEGDCKKEAAFILQVLKGGLEGELREREAESDIH